MARIRPVLAATAALATLSLSLAGTITVAQAAPTAPSASTTVAPWAGLKIQMPNRIPAGKALNVGVSGADKSAKRVTLAKLTSGKWGQVGAFRLTGGKGTVVVPKKDVTSNPIMFRVTAGKRTNVFVVDTDLKKNGLTRVPARVTGLTGTTYATQVNLKWAKTTGAARYLVEQSTNAGATWAYTTDTAARKTTVKFLTTGVDYLFRVTAINGAGAGAPAYFETVTQANPPAGVTGLEATARDSKVSLKWTAAARSTVNRVERTCVENVGFDNAVCPVAVRETPNTMFAWNGLTNGTTYLFRVTAKNMDGAGPGTTTVATPQASPLAIASFTAYAGNALISADWTAVDTAEQYRLAVAPMNSNAWTYSRWTANTTATVSGLVNGTAYKAMIEARNSFGATQSTIQSNLTPSASAPTAIQGVTAKSGDQQVTLTWPSATSATTYTVRYRENGSDNFIKSNSVTRTNQFGTTTHTVTDLANGAAHDFEVVAVNSNGRTGAAVTSATPSFNSQFRGLPAPRGAIGRSALIARIAADVTAQAVPNAPATVTATPYSTRATVAWTGVSGATGYTVSYATSNNGPWTAFTTAGSTARSVSVTGLTNGTTYYFQVQAVNSDGTGAGTVAGPVTPIAVPPPVSNLSALASNGQIVANWNGSSAATRYRVLYRPTTSSTWAVGAYVDAPNTNYVIPGLTNGTGYYVQVTAWNQSGFSTNSQVGPIVPSASVPTTPGPITATPGNGQVTLEWPIIDGATGYQVFTTGAVALTSVPPSTVPADMEEYTISGLTNGTPYNFVVVAYNDYGVSIPAQVGPYTPGVTPPAAPTNLTATAGDGEVTIAFTPGADGGSSIVNYAYSLNNGDFTPLNPAVATSPVTVTGLTNGTTYSIELAAINANGQTGASSSAISVTPVATTVAPPTNLVATPGNGQVSIAFNQTVPSGVTVTNYSYSLNGGNTWTALSPAVTASPVVITGLTNGTTYSIQLQAAASNDTTSAASETVTATPAAVPSAPTGLAATAGNASATISFTPGANGGSPITNYAYSTNGGSTWTPLSPASTANPFTVTGLTNGTTYSVQIAAINAVGQGAASTAVSVTPTAAPGAVTGLVVTPGDGSANLTWDATSGATGYNVWLTCGIPTGDSAPQSGVGCPQISWPTTNTTFNINSSTSAGLVNGTTYAVAVQAVNSSGTGPKGTWVNVTPGTTPAAPTDLVASAADGSAVIAFAPGNNGGAAITNYAYTTDSGTTWTPLSPAQTGSPITITGLTNGTAYDIEIAAVNSFGQGAASASVSVTPQSEASAPSDLVATAGNEQVTITFTAGDYGAASVTNYQYSTDGGSTWTAFSPAVTASPVTITGLTNGTTYNIALQAVLSTGTSAASPVVVATPFTTPAAPTALVATAGDEEVSIAFTPGSDNGAAITNYAYSVNGGALTPLPIPQTGSPIVLGGLTNGTAYTIEIAAINAAGTGATASVGPTTPYGAPTAPTSLVATTGDGEVSVAFTAAGANGNTITNYMVSTDGGDTWTALSPAATTSPITFTSLTNGTAYELGIAGVNAAGMGDAAFVTATPAAVPAAPTIDNVTPGNGQVSVEFTAGSDNGAAITNYQYTINGGATWVTLSPAQAASPLTITGLTNGTAYTVAIKAVNSTGASAASNTSPAFTPFTDPSAPTNLVGTAGDGEASISFTPATSGGYEIANYVYTLNGGTSQTAFSPATTTSPVTVTDLTNDTTYTIQLAAVDSQGNQGPWSAAVSVTPAGTVTVPDAPTGVTVTLVTATTANVAWTAPANDGGSALTSYSVTVSPSAGVTVTPGAFPATTASLSGLTAGQTYTVSVTAANTAGDSAAATSAAFNTGTLTPTGLAASVSDNNVQLTWNATTGAGSYLIYECAVTAPATSCNPVTDDTAPTAATSSPYTYTLNWNTTYNFAIAAVADSITGTASATVTATIGAPPVPAEPTISTWYPQSTDGGTGGTTVAWSEVDYATYYTCNGTNIGTATTCSLTANPDTQISYSIEACNSSGCSTAATQNTATNPNGSAQAAPTWVYNTQPGGSGSDRCVTVSWNGFASSNQYVFNANGAVPSDQQSPITGTSYQWCGASPTETYTFTVQGVNQLTPWPPATWDTMYYGTATPSSTTLPVVPAIPTSGPTATPGNGIDLSTSSSYGNVTVTWPAVPGATSYILWRTDAVAPWYLSGTSYQDTGLAWNDSYTYELSVCSAVGCSAYGPGTTVTTAPAPALFSISTIGAGQYSTNPGTLYINVASMPSGANAYQIFACDSSINPGCNPYTSGTGFGWITTTGFLQTPISGLNSGDSYNIGVLTAQTTSGGGLNTQAVVQSTTSP